MVNITWKYVKPLEEVHSVESFLEQNGVIISPDIVECIKRNNGGRPSVKIFDTDMRKERVVKSLLSYNINDRETIYMAYSKDLKDKSLFPFATDPAGNYICVSLNDNRIVFFESELNRIEHIASDFSSFLKNLY